MSSKLTIAEKHVAAINKDVVESIINVHDLDNKIRIFKDGSGISPSYYDGSLVALSPEAVKMYRSELGPDGQPD